MLLKSLSLAYLALVLPVFAADLVLSSRFGQDVGSLDYPQAVCSDQTGQYYLADTRHNRILYINAQGQSQLIAGTGELGYNGDNIAANQAQLARPQGLLYHQGRLCIADSNNDRVRMLDNQGIIHTIAGTGKRGYSGDAGAALAAKLSAPVALAIDSQGRIYINDRNNNVIRRIDAQGIISTVAGGAPFSRETIGDGQLATEARLNLPGEIALDAADNLYIADMGNNRIRRVDANTQQISTVAGNGYIGLFQSRVSGDGGLAVRAGISLPYGLSLDSQGNIYFSSIHHDTIRKISTAGIIETVAGNGYSGYAGDGADARSARLNGVYSLSHTSGGALLIADASNHRIRQLAPNQAPTAIIKASATQGIAPLTVKLDGRTSSDVEAELMQFAWSSPALGHISSHAQTQVIFPKAGIYSLRLRVTDKAGSVQHSDIAINVRDNQPPKAVFSWQISGSDLYANAAASTDADADSLDFNWSLNDSFAHQGTQLHLQLPHSGQYKLGLLVTDAYGATDSLQQGIYFDANTNSNPESPAAAQVDQPPVAHFSIVQQRQDDQLWLTLDARHSYDAEGELSYRWQSSAGKQARGEQVNWALIPDHVEHITLIVTDSSGQQDQQTQAVFTPDLCVGAGAYGDNNQILQLPIVRVAGDISDQAFQVTLQKAADQPQFSISQIRPLVGMAATQSPCQAMYYENGQLDLSQIDINNSKETQALSAQLQYDASNARLNIEQVQAIPSQHTKP